MAAKRTGVELRSENMYKPIRKNLHQCLVPSRRLQTALPTALMMLVLLLTWLLLLMSPAVHLRLENGEWKLQTRTISCLGNGWGSTRVGGPSPNNRRIRWKHEPSERPE